MTRWIICAIVLASAVAGCGGSGAESSSGESLASVQQPVSSTCKNFDGYTAALAEATIACLGAVGPFDYTTDANGGFLVPTFDKCPAELDAPRDQVQSPALLRIKRLLSMQLPNRQQDGKLNAVACIRDAYLRASKVLIDNGITVCPTWHRVFVGGVPTPRNTRLLASRFPVARIDEKKGQRVIDPPKRGSGFRFPKEYPFYTVSFDNANATVPPDQKCGSAQNCAKVCSTLFEGFFVGRFGRYIVGDPFWWLDPTDYGGFDEVNDPYNRVNGYYHPMSLAGDDVPGEIYGDFGRAAFADPSTKDIDHSAEQCTRWDGSDHVMGRLVQDFGIPDDPTTWLSRCEFYPQGGIDF